VFSIIISEKGGAERRQSFDQFEVTVGRVQGNDLVLPKGNVSKRHCRLELVDGAFQVTDQNSTNGTYLNRRRILQTTTVRQGDRIYVGDFVLRIEPGAAEEDLAGAGPGSLPIGAGPSVVAPPPFPSSPPPPTAGVPSSPLQPQPLSPPATDGFAQPVAAASSGLGAVGVTTDERPSEISSRRDGTWAEPSEPDAETTDEALVSAVGAVVDRVVSKTSPAELNSPLAQRRVETLVDAALRELGAQPGIEADDVRPAALAELLALGPLSELLEDPSVAEIAASGAGYLTVVRGSNRQLSPQMPFCGTGSLDRAVERLCVRDGVALSPAERSVRRELPSFGFSLEYVRGEFSPHGSLLHLTRRERVAATFEDLVRAGTVSRTIATFLQQCVAGSANLLVVGQARSGAAEVLSALCHCAGGRVLALCQDRELATSDGRVLCLNDSRGQDFEATFSRVAKMPGHRLVVDGLVQGGRALATLRVVSEGATGVVARLRARSIERGLAQLCAQMAVAHHGLSVTTVADALISTFDLALEVARLPDGRTRVVRVAELGRGDTLPVVGHDIFGFNVERIATGGAVEGSFNPTGRRPHFANELRTRGARLDTGMFARAARAPYPAS